jgi:CheY-like chemotaxis protein
VPTAEDRIRRRHSGRRVLLVEDNLVNREVAEDLLQSVGLVVEAAENGEAAVELACSRSYDVVLMDVMMPVMDGLAATREIRRIRGDSLPIIAMTANAFAEDRKLCLAAGMNDHLAKPVEPSRLYTILLRWLPLHSTPVRDRLAPTMPGPLLTPDDVLAARLRQVPNLDVDAGLRNVGGRVQTLARALGRFADIYRRGAPMLLGSTGAEHRIEWRRACHSMGGACAAVGAVRLAALALDIDQDAILGRGDASLSESGLRLHVELVAFSRAVMRVL